MNSELPFHTLIPSGFRFLGLRSVSRHNLCLPIRRSTYDTGVLENVSSDLHPFSLPRGLLERSHTLLAYTNRPLLHWDVQSLLLKEQSYPQTSYRNETTDLPDLRKKGPKTLFTKNPSESSVYLEKEPWLSRGALPGRVSLSPYLSVFDRPLLFLSLGRPLILFNKQTKI